MRMLLSLSLLALLVMRADADLLLELHAGGHDRENCPVFFALPDDLSDTRSFTLVRESDNKEIPVQRAGFAKAPRIAWMVSDLLESGQKRRYKLVRHQGRPARDNRVSLDDDGQKLTVSVRGAPVLRFNHAIVEAPEGIDRVYRRSGYLHPVFTPQGNVVTGDFEKDHPHQHGVFNAWVNAAFRDQPVDFWNQAKGKGDVEFRSFQGKRQGPVFAQFVANLVHVAIRDGERVPAINEKWQVRVFNSQAPFLFEIWSRQTLASADPVIVHEYHYGGFGLRGPAAWLTSKKPDSDATTQELVAADTLAAAGFLTSEGRTRIDGNHTRARWVELHGPVGSQHAGIITLGANNNFRAPQTVRLHPSKPYFCFAPMVLGKYSLESDEVYGLRYRFVVHDGEPNPELAERMWQDLAHPPKVKVID